MRVNLQILAPQVLKCKVLTRGFLLYCLVEYFYHLVVVSLESERFSRFTLLRLPPSAEKAKYKVAWAKELKVSFI